MVIWAHTFLESLIIQAALLALHALRIGRTGSTVLTIKERVVQFAVSTLALPNIVNLLARAHVTGQVTKIPKPRVLANHASAAVEEVIKPCIAHAFMLGIIDLQMFNYRYCPSGHSEHTPERKI